VWALLEDKEKGPPLEVWLGSLEGKRQLVPIPDGKAKALGANHLYNPHGVDFIQGKTVHHEDYAGVEQASLVAMLANLEIRGDVEVPADEDTCRRWRRAIESRLATARRRFESRVASRTGSEELREDAVDLLMQWFIHGREET